MKHSLPAAIFFDLGGVLFQVHPCPAGYNILARHVDQLLERASGMSPGIPRIEADLKAASHAYGNWKNAQSRRAHCREITHREYWEDFVAADWSEPARSAVVAHASTLCLLLEQNIMERLPTLGALELLQRLAEMGIRTGCVSNALSGACSRMLMKQHGFEEWLGIQIYSDEMGIRKPNPEIFQWATRSLNVAAQNCWYVGDKLDRDVLAGRRAGIGRVILMPSEETNTGAVVTAEPDHTIRTPLELLDLLNR
jgi:HAD superfamily hydrolase (TIGR01549 family)